MPSAALADGAQKIVHFELNIWQPLAGKDVDAKPLGGEAG
jgi:hypothetical protein